MRNRHASVAILIFNNPPPTPRRNVPLKRVRRYKYVMLKGALYCYTVYGIRYTIFAVSNLYITYKCIYIYILYSESSCACIHLYNYIYVYIYIHILIHTYLFRIKRKNHRRDLILNII